MEGATPHSMTLAERILKTPPAVAALAETVAEAAGDEDVIFCNSEAISLPIAARLARRRGPKIASLVHNVSRPRVAAVNTLQGALRRIDRIFAVSPTVSTALARKFRDGRVTPILEQIDDAFFTPGDAAKKQRPVIASVGLEQRDYRTLAAATDGLDADIRISGFSKDAKVMAETFPETLPANMTSRFYEWRDLAQLYRNADIVVVPLRPNAYAAGITSILEAAAARRPVIATRTRGIDGAFADASAVLWVPPEDADALRSEIERLLDDAAMRDRLAAAAHAAFNAHHREDLKAGEMAAYLRRL